MAQQVSDKTVRRLARLSGLDVVRASNRGGSGSFLDATLSDGRRVWMHTKTGEVRDELEGQQHFPRVAQSGTHADRKTPLLTSPDQNGKNRQTGR